MSKLTILVSLLLVASCSSQSGSSRSEPTTTNAPVAEVVPPEQDKPVNEAWADLTMEQKQVFMKDKVVPAMTTIWQESPEPDEVINCATCHGPGAKQGQFAMPSPALPALNPADGFAAHKDEAAWLQFMGAKVTPTMAEVLGVPPYNPETNSGFGCFACHTAQ